MSKTLPHTQITRAECMAMRYLYLCDIEMQEIAELFDRQESSILPHIFGNCQMHGTDELIPKRVGPIPMLEHER